MGRAALAAGAALAVSCVTCGPTLYEPHFVPPKHLGRLEGELKDVPFLKCHMTDGRIFVLEDWKVDEAAGEVRGHGIEYDADRIKLGYTGNKTVPIHDVALFETNRPYEGPGSGSVIAASIVLAVATGASLALTAYCLSNTKACFGSCPTFFADDGHGLSLQAEGFSGSVARSLEATDVDAMWTAVPDGRRLDVVMTNDALETHAVASVRVLVAPRPAGGRVLRAGSTYYPATHFLSASSVRASSGDVADALRASDGVEYKSPASPMDLAEREVLEARFERVPKGKRLGLLVVDRNSLLNTFLFYQAIAFMGSRYGDWMAQLERRGKAAFAGVGGLLGDIDVSARAATGAFVSAGHVGEVGPIAREAEVVVLPAGLSGDVDVRLTMAKGNWKIDQIALVELGDPVEPSAVVPHEVLRGDKPDADALAALRDPARYLVTFPHDAYTLRFELPPNGDGRGSELFLESRGYYYEWMRQEWLRDEDQLAALQLVLDPAAALRKLAPTFKAIEPEMDRVFWQSRVTRW
ncbi:MAG TPA: hypothetical protein VLM85_09220 [Polyangiaceae bacterium]|nr:hypothetical protein [Polyangiaceae bacterium]